MKKGAQLGIWLIIVSSLFLMGSGCQELPEPPDGILCIMHIEKDENGKVIAEDSKAVCAPLGDVKSDISDWEKKRLVINSPDRIDVPLGSLDSFVTTGPDTWGNIVAYVKKLKDLARRRCD